MNVRDILAGFRIVQPFSVHDELIFVTSGSKYQSLFPQAVIRTSDPAQADWLPLVEIAADMDVLRTHVIQNKANLAACQDGGGFFRFRFVLRTPCFF